MELLTQSFGPEGLFGTIFMQKVNCSLGNFFNPDLFLSLPV